MSALQSQIFLIFTPGISPPISSVHTVISGNHPPTPAGCPDNEVEQTIPWRLVSGSGGVVTLKCANQNGQVLRDDNIRHLVRSLHPGFHPSRLQCVSPRFEAVTGPERWNSTSDSQSPTHKTRHICSLCGATDGDYSPAFPASISFLFTGADAGRRHRDAS